MEWIVSLTPAATDDPRAAVVSPPEKATVVELRADLFADADIRGVVESCPLPVLVTFRSTFEGGMASTDPQLRRRLIASARNAGASLLDLEYQRDLHLIDELGLEPERIVVSWHDVDGTPQNLADQARAMLEHQNARWIKIVPTANSFRDARSVLALLATESEPNRGNKRLITFAMGLQGQCSRFLAPLIGPPVMFASWDSSGPAAPGQLPIAAIDSAIGHLEGPPQRLYGILGGNVSGSLSPTMHGAGYRSLDLPYAMIPVSVADEKELDDIFLPEGKDLFGELGLCLYGLAVTAPYKELACRRATLKAPRVNRAEAANTLMYKPGEIVGENTDADGVVGSLVRRGVNPQGRIALIQGTGGAARGAAIGLHLAGADVFLRGRDGAVTRDWADRLQLGYCAPDEIPDNLSILVNATPLGSQADDPSPFSEEEARSADAILDMVYAQHKTATERTANSTGCEFLDGREMLFFQGISQFAAFTERPAPREAMRQALYP